MGTDTFSTFSISPLDAVSEAESIVAARANGRDREPDHDWLAPPPTEADPFVREIPRAEIAARPQGDGMTSALTADASGEAPVRVVRQRELRAETWPPPVTPTDEDIREWRM